MLLYKSVTFPAFRTLSFPAVAPRGAAGRPVHPCSNPDGPRQLPVQWFCYNTESQMAVILGPTPYKMATPRSPVSKSWIDHWSCFFSFSSYVFSIVTLSSSASSSSFPLLSTGAYLINMSTRSDLDRLS